MRKVKVQSRILLARDTCKKNTSKRTQRSRMLSTYDIKKYKVNLMFLFSPVFAKQSNFSQTGSAYDRRMRSQVTEG